MSESESDPFDYVDVSDFESPDANQRRDTLEHTVVEHDDRPDELSVYPREVENGAFKQCMVAEDGSFVLLADWR